MSLHYSTPYDWTILHYISSNLFWRKVSLLVSTVTRWGSDLSTIVVSKIVPYIFIPYIFGLFPRELSFVGLFYSPNSYEWFCSAKVMNNLIQMVVRILRWIENLPSHSSGVRFKSPPNRIACVWYLVLRIEMTRRYLRICFVHCWYNHKH